MARLIVSDHFPIEILLGHNTLAFMPTQNPCMMLKKASIIESAIQDERIARLFSLQLGIELPTGIGRVAFLNDSTILLIGHYQGPELTHEGRLPCDGQLNWWNIERCD